MGGLSLSGLPTGTKTKWWRHYPMHMHPNQLTHTHKHMHIYHFWDLRSINLTWNLYIILYIMYIIFIFQNLLQPITHFDNENYFIKEILFSPLRLYIIIYYIFIIYFIYIILYYIYYLRIFCNLQHMHMHSYLWWYLQGTSSR